jgi:hypothetical protein
MGKKIAIKLKKKDKAIKAGSTHTKDTGGFFNAKVAAIVRNLRDRK